MQYRRDRKGNEISLLGFGCMRFEGGGTGEYFGKANDQVMKAIDQGVNYFDTAYVYKNNEKVLGRILAENQCRDRVYIATKLPQYLVKSVAQAEKIFCQELESLQTDHIDYYLMHMLNDLNSWERMRKLGIDSWIEEKLASGKIRNIGFSYHGNTENFRPLADAYDWDFCQIQYNYADENIQAGRSGLEYAASKGLPVIIMEPLRGGRLVGMLPAEAKRHIKEAGESAARLAFRWLYDQPQVTCVLSGMNTDEMVSENIKTACESYPGCLTEKEKVLVEVIKEDVRKSVPIACTGCNYCSSCPAGVDIPAAFSCYNSLVGDKDSHARWKYIQMTVFRNVTTNASKCIGCGACAAKCPQHLPVPELVKKAGKKLENVKFKAVNTVVHLFRIY